MSNTPVGTITPSMLPPEKYAEATGENDLEDYSDRTWVPADGRPVPGSKYANIIGANVPDLRGSFLRCVNIMESAPPIPLNSTRKDPADRPPGDFKQDSVRSHSHPFQYYGAVRGNSSHHWHQGDGNDEDVVIETRSFGAVTAGPNEGNVDETAPKNVAVYHYIRIN